MILKKREFRATTQIIKKWLKELSANTKSKIYNNVIIDLLINPISLDILSGLMTDRLSYLHIINL